MKSINSVRRLELEIFQKVDTLIALPYETAVEVLDTMSLVNDDILPWKVI